MSTEVDGRPDRSESGADSAESCYRCDAEIPPGATRCPNCGRRQTRTCYCGKEIPVTAVECPYCGADWSNARRVRRKRSKSPSIKPTAVAKAAFIGGVISLAVLYVTHVVISVLARYADAPTEGSAGYPQKLSLAYDGLMQFFARVGQILVSHQGSLLVVGIGLVLGAILGSIIYLGRIGAIKLSKKKSSRRRRSSRSSSESSSTRMED